MKIPTTLLLISLFLIGCGSRKRNLTKTEDKSKFENSSSVQQNISSSSSTSSITDIRNFIIDSGLKIKSNGQNYELKFGDLTFSGSADLEFSKKEEEKIIHHLYQLHTTYVTETKYVRKIKYEIQRIYRVVDVERKGLTFGSVIWIVIVSLVAGAVLWEILKKYLPNWRLNLFNRKND